MKTMHIKKIAATTTEHAIWGPNIGRPNQKRWQNVMAAGVWLPTPSRLVIYEQFPYLRA